MLLAGQPSTFAQDVKHLSPSVGPTAHTPAHHAGFTAWRQGDDTIRLFDGATVTDIEVNTDGVSDPHTNNGIVVWEGQVSDGSGGFTSQIFLYDVSQGGSPVQITSTAYPNVLPRVWRNQPIGTSGDYYIAWRGEVPGDPDVFFYFSNSGGSPTITQIQRAGDDVPGHANAFQNHLDIEDDLIAWQGLDGSDLNIFVADVTGLSVPSGTALDISDGVDVDPNALDAEPQTSAGYVVWRHTDGTPAIADTIYSWEAATKSIFIMQSESTNSELLRRPMIDRDPSNPTPPVGMVAWTAYSDASDRYSTEIEGRLSIAPNPISNPLVVVTSNDAADEFHFVQDGVLYWQHWRRPGMFGTFREFWRQWDYLNPSAPSPAKAGAANDLQHHYLEDNLNSSAVNFTTSDQDSAVYLRTLQSTRNQVDLRFPASLGMQNGPNPGEAVFNIQTSFWGDAPSGKNSIFRVFLSRKGGAIYTTKQYPGSGVGTCDTPLAWGGELVGYSDNSTPDGTFRKMSLDGFNGPQADLLYTWSQNVNGGSGIQAPLGSFTNGTASGSTQPMVITNAISGETVFAAAWIAVEESPGVWKIRSITPTICFTAP